MEEYKGDWTEETTQKILLYMYENKVLDDSILEHLLSGIYKKIAITGAKHEFDILKLDYGKDDSPKLPNGNSMREEALRGVEKGKIW